MHFSYNTSLYYTIQHYTLQHCTILYYTVQYYTVQYYTILYYTILYYTILYYTILYYTILYCTVLYCTLLYCTVLYCTVLCYAVFYSSITPWSFFSTPQNCSIQYKMCDVAYWGAIQYSTVNCIVILSSTMLHIETLFNTVKCIRHVFIPLFFQLIP